MNSKKILKLNDNDDNLSLGNIFRIIKLNAINPNSFLQSDLFCIIFDCDTIGTSTVNNYCTGARGINSTYKNYILKQKELYETQNNALIPMISKILKLINYGKFSSKIYTIEEINNDNKLKNICTKLHTISKNDTDVDFVFSSKLLHYLNGKKYYDFFVETLFFTVLEKIQPKFKENILTEVIEKNLYNTNISVNDIEKFMKIQLNSGIWSIRGLIELANQKNPFACFEMASLEFYGIISGVPRYDKAYEYYKIASDNNHPVAHWSIGFLFYNGYIGNKSNEDLENAYNYFLKAKELKCSNAFNSLGLIYLNGTIPKIKKDYKMAKELFEHSANMGNVYAHNNLGMIAENEKNYKKAFEHYLISANSGDSWALNKMGQFYRLGIYVDKNLQNAYDYYKKASECPKISLCPWSKYNLAKYFYKSGAPEIYVFSNINKAIELLDDIATILIQANEELIYIYYDLYISNSKSSYYLSKLEYYVTLIEKNVNYNEDLKNRIEEKLNKLKKDSINIINFI